MRKEQKFTQLDVLLLPLCRIFQKFPQINLTATAAFPLRQGQVINEDTNVAIGLVSLRDAAGAFIGIGEVQR